MLFVGYLKTPTHTARSKKAFNSVMKRNGRSSCDLTAGTKVKQSRYRPGMAQRVPGS